MALTVNGIATSRAVLEDIDGDPAFYEEYLVNEHVFFADLKLTFAGVA